MTLADLAARPPGILCPMWTTHTAGSRRCKYYVDGGACELPTQLMCVEWLIRNHEMPELEAELQEGRFETPEQFRIRFDREVAERSAANEFVKLPRPAPTIETTGPPAMPPAPPPSTGPTPQLPSSLTDAISKLSALKTETPPAPVKPPGMSEALARLLAMKK